MGENFMSAITQIDDLVSKKRQIIDRAASLLAEAILDRMHTGNLTKNTEKDIRNAIRSFSPEEQSDILSRALIYIGMNGTKNRNSNNNDGDDYRSDRKVKSRSDLFGRRFDD